MSTSTDSTAVADLVAQAQPVIKSLEASGRDSAARIMSALTIEAERLESANERLWGAINAAEGCLSHATFDAAAMGALSILREIKSHA